MVTLFAKISFELFGDRGNHCQLFFVSLTHVWRIEMPADYIPRSDSEFDVWLNNFTNYVVANLVLLGLLPADGTALQSARDDFNAAFTANIAAQATAQGARAAKDSARSITEEYVRGLVARLQASPDVDDQERESMGITVRDTTSTARPVPTTPPIAIVNAAQRLQHTIDFRDSTNSTSRAKPFGVQGVEIWMAITPIGTPAPTDPSEFAFVTLDTSTPHLIEFAGADGGKNAHYILRWVNTTGQKGPWSEVVSATINA